MSTAALRMVREGLAAETDRWVAESQVFSVDRYFFILNSPWMQFKEQPSLRCNSSLSHSTVITGAGSYQTL